ncbi:MAG TPA: cytidylate kinase-like family protein [Ktedonobacteraceae bacterium]|jgi:cytidylate kinase|nr:cytidylate kinase-like family protein [Ktedonobacteraceae bacterium]
MIEQNNGPAQQQKAEMRAITISRQYGSGGGEIALRLAQRLGWRLLDHDAVVHVAQQLGISVEEAEEHDEHVESLGVRILTSMQMIQPTMAASLPVQITPNIREYHEALCRVVEATVRQEKTVVVGRGGQMLFAGRRDILHARVVAPLEQRVAYVMRREGLEYDAAMTRVHEKDQGRIRYLQAQYHRHPSDPLLYDLVVNTGVLSLDRCVDLICLALEAKAERLTLPEEKLGPATEMPPYPGQPADFLVPPDTGSTH